MRFRTTTIGVSWIEAVKSWSQASLIFKDGDKKVVVKLDGPADIGYLRERLDEIENDWRQRLGNK